MTSYHMDTFFSLFQRLPLAEQVAKLGETLELVKRLPGNAADRPLSEIADCIDRIESLDNAEVDLTTVRAQLVELALRRLLRRHPGESLRFSVLGRDEIVALLPRLQFSPPISEDQIGSASIDLTVAAPAGKGAGDVFELPKDTLVVTTAVEQHGAWPDDVVAYVSIRSAFAQRGLDHANSPWIYPRYCRPLKLEFISRKEPLTLTAGVDRPVQLTLFRVSGPRSEAHTNGRGNGNGQKDEDVHPLPQHGVAS